MAKLPSKAKRGKRRWIGVEYSQVSLARGDALKIAKKFIGCDRVKLYDLEVAEDGSSMLGILEIKHDDLALAKSNLNEGKWSELGIRSLTMSGKINLVRDRLSLEKPKRRK